MSEQQEEKCRIWLITSEKDKDWLKTQFLKMIDDAEKIILTKEVCGSFHAPTKKKDFFRLPNPVVPKDAAKNISELLNMDRFAIYTTYKPKQKVDKKK